jgi:hypothetical protein
MKLLWTAVLAVACVGPAVALQAPETHSELVAVSIDKIEVKDIAPDRIRFDIRSHVTADRKLGIKQVHFERMRLGSLPVYLSPIEEHLQLEKGAAITLPAVPLTIYFRDLDSLEPLERAVQDGQATVSGKARVDLDLNLLERVISRQWGATADLPIAMSIPVEVPGGSIGKGAASAALRAAQLALNVGGSALNLLRQSQKNWEKELRAHYATSLVIAESRYSLRLRNGEVADFVVRGLGFRSSDTEFVLTGEMVEPWKYDVQVASALHSGEASLIAERRDLLVWPNGEDLNATTARSLSRNLIRVERVAGKQENAYVAAEGKSVKVPLAKRDADNNYALVRFLRPEDKGTAVHLAPEAARGNQNWERLTMFRLDDDGTLELISSPATRNRNRVLLEDSIDDHAFGSLLIAPEGAVGMVQDEHSGLVVRDRW